MPANLSPEYKAADARFRQAVTPDEKLEALQEMLATIPKHKGTEKMQADLKKRIARMKLEEEQREKHGKRGGQFRVEKQGAGQAVLVGFPNVGKSSLVAAMTNAHPEVADYPFTTHLPGPGIMPFENVQLQLVDTPPLTEDIMEPWLPDLVRRADIALLVVDAGSDDALEQVEMVRKRFAAMHVDLTSRDPGGTDRQHLHRRTLLVANKSDAAGAEDRLEILREMCGAEFTILTVSAKTGHGLEDFRRSVWEFMEKIRVYTKVPGKKADKGQPYVLQRGSTVLDLASSIHKDFVAGLKSARIWGSGSHDGQQVSRDHVLSEGDIVELHL
ncbi:MAG: GTPase [Acidobacteriota bacterium]